MNIAPADLIRHIEAGRAWPSLPMSEQIALRAMMRRIVAMANDGTTAEDWQQLAGYAEWAASKPTTLLPELTVAGQWIDWKGGRMPVALDTVVEAQMRNGVKASGRAGGWRWNHEQIGGDIIAYRLVD